MTEEQEKLLQKSRDLADKCFELKAVVEKMLDELDLTHQEYLDVIKQIKQCQNQTN